MKQFQLLALSSLASALIENPTEELFESTEFTRGGIFQEILGGGVPPDFQILTLFQTEKRVISQTRFQTRPLRNYVIIT